jgi:hypothetical protein
MDFLKFSRIGVSISYRIRIVSRIEAS